jgi:outer membrane protein
MRLLRLVALLAIPAQVAFGQQPSALQGPGKELTLDEAIATAQRNNPALHQTQNNVRNYDAQVRSAYGQLLPNAGANIRTTFNQGGTQYVNGVPLPGSNGDYYQSGYSIGVGYNLNASAAFAPRAAKAFRNAAEADVTSSAEFVRAEVTRLYITALQSEALAEVLDSLVQTAAGQVNLVTAKMEAGAGTIIDVRTAEVALGQSQVSALTTRNQSVVDKLRLFQTMGVPADTNVKLTSTFSVAKPTFSLDSVLDIARRANPDVAARKLRADANQLQVRVAQTAYLPRLNLSTGWGWNAFGYTDSEILALRAQANAESGYSSCLRQDSLRAGAGLPHLSCGSPTLTAEQLSAERAKNQPFKFSKSPFSLTAQLQLPLFDGFSREQQLEQARASRDNALYDLRARQLQLVTDVTQFYLQLVTSAKTVELQTQIAAKAAEDLALNEASYRVGAKTFLDVSTARATYEKAQIDRVNSIYEYHKAFAALENAVGRPLR